MADPKRPQPPPEPQRSPPARPAEPPPRPQPFPGRKIDKSVPAHVEPETPWPRK